MKFARQLGREAFPEWAAHYVAYKHLKRAVGDDPERFLAHFRRELDKVETFFARQRALVEARVSALEDAARGCSRDPLPLLEQCEEVRMWVRRLGHYCALNLAGLHKILRKYDRAHPGSALLATHYPPPGAGIAAHGRVLAAAGERLGALISLLSDAQARPGAAQALEDVWRVVYGLRTGGVFERDDATALARDVPDLDGLLARAGAADDAACGIAEREECMLLRFIVESVCRCGAASCLSLLLARGLDVPQYERHTGASLVHHALCSRALFHGVSPADGSATGDDVDARDGRTAAVAAALVAAGASIDAVDARGRTVFHRVCAAPRGRHVSVLEDLLRTALKRCEPAADGQLADRVHGLELDHSLDHTNGQCEKVTSTAPKECESADSQLADRLTQIERDHTNGQSRETGHGDSQSSANLGNANGASGSIRTADSHSRHGAETGGHDGFSGGNPSTDHSTDTNSQETLAPFLKGDGNGCTPLFFAIEAGCVAKVSLLHGAARGTSPLVSGPWSATPWTHVLLAARMGHAGVLRVLASQGHSLDDAGAFGEPPVFVCAKTGALECVSALLECGASVDARESFSGMTALGAAAMAGHGEIVDVLLAHGADVDATDAHGWSAHDHAVYHGHLRLASRILGPAQRAELADIDALPCPAVDYSDPALVATAQSGQVADAASERAPNVSGSLSYPSDGGSAGRSEVASSGTGDESDAKSKKTIVDTANGSSNPVGAGDISDARGKKSLDQDMGSSNLSDTRDESSIKSKGALDADKGSETMFYSKGNEDRIKGSKSLYAYKVSGDQGDAPLQGQGVVRVTVSSVDVPLQHHAAELRVSLGDDGDAFPLPADGADRAYWAERVVTLRLPGGPPAGHVFVDVQRATPAGAVELVARGVLSLGAVLSATSAAHDVGLLGMPGLRPTGRVVLETLVARPLPALRVPRPRPGPWRRVRESLIGHRGAGSDSSAAAARRLAVRENTALSIMAAASLGARAVEVDVQVCRDGVPVLFHDFGVRVGPALLPVSALSLAELRAATGRTGLRGRRGSREDVRASVAGVESSKSGSGVVESPCSTLAEALRGAPAGLGFNVELKYPTAADAAAHAGLRAPDANAYVDAVLSVLFAHAGARDVLLSSFHPDVCLLAALKQAAFPVFFLTHADADCAPDDWRAASLHGAATFAEGARLAGVVCNAAPLVAAPRTVARVKARGLLLLSYGDENDDVAAVRVQRAFGVDAVIVNAVGRVRRGLDETRDRCVRTSEE